MQSTKLRAKSLLLTSVLLLGAGCATHHIAQQPNGRFQVKDTFNQYSPEDEVQLGRQAEAEANKQLPILPESNPISQYIERLGEDLAAKAPGYKYPYSFHVVNEKDINAFALPGGPIYINLGAIQAADDEGEIAGVLAHEISHVALRHSTSSASKEQYIELPLAILGQVLPTGIGGQLARLGINFGAGTLFMKYSRTAESEADLMGAQIMYDAGYNPSSMVEFFQKLEKEGGPGAPQFLSDHPNPGNRQEAVRQAIAKFPKKNFGRHDSADFARIKADADKMHPLTAEQIAQRQQQQQQPMGQVNQQQIAPSGRFNVFDHNAYQIAYPANWKVFGDANSSVVIAPEAGVSQDQIAYGVMIGGLQPRGGQMALDAAMQQLAQTIVQGNPGMRQASALQRTQVNGMPAETVDLIGQSPLSGPNGPVAERDLLMTLQRPDGVIMYAVFIAPQQDFNALSPTFQQMLQSIRMRPVS